MIRGFVLAPATDAALRGVDLELEAGEFTVVMGPSGSGKTTLLNIIGCLDRPTAGSYVLDGEAIGDRDFNDLADIRNRKIGVLGVIFLNFNQIPGLSVRENFEFPRVIRGEGGAMLNQRVEAIARDVGLTDFLHHKPDELSGAQRQRVAIPRALVTGPQLVLADEPTANLDSKTSVQNIDLMLALNCDKGVTFLFSTHYPRVMEHARRVVSTHDGVIVDGTAAAEADVARMHGAAG